MNRWKVLALRNFSPHHTEATAMARQFDPIFFPLVAGLVLFAFVTAASAATKDIQGGPIFYRNSWALVVGINRYKDPKIPRLKYAEADARAVKERLVQVGFPERNIRSLLGHEATREAILMALEEDLNPRMERGDRLFIYFSGHGASTALISLADMQRTV